MVAPRRFGLLTHTLTAPSEKNPTSVRSCQAKISVSPTSRLHCTTKASLRTREVYGYGSEGTCYGTGIIVPYLCIIVSCDSNAGIDIPDSARVWKARSSEGPETTQRNRNHFAVDTHRSGVLSCRPLTTIEGTSSVRARHTRGRRRPICAYLTPLLPCNLMCPHAT